jgi:hypothetical protein
LVVVGGRLIEVLHQYLYLKLEQHNEHVVAPVVLAGGLDYFG